MSVEFFSLKQKHQQTHIQVEWNTVKQQNMLIKRKCRDWCAGVSSHRSQEWKVTCLTFPLWVQWLHSGYLKLVTVSCGSSTTEVNVSHNLEFCFFVWVFFFFFLIQFSRTPLVLSHKKFVTWGGLQQYEFNIWTALRKKDSMCSIWSQRVMWGAAGKHFRKIVFNVGKSLRLKVSIGMGAHLEGCRGWMTLYKDLQI